MNQTSLQNIISRNISGIREAEIQNFFVPPQYPQFEISDLQSKPHLMQHSKFSIFMAVLNNWNIKVATKDPSLNETDYHKNEFIFSWLKSIAVQNSKFLDSSLKQLHEWYTANAEKDFERRVRPENASKARLEDWEIRNSYKSNMPLEIDSYRRRILLEQNQNQQLQGETDKDIFRKCSEGIKDCIADKKKENNYLRGVRQDQEMAEFQTTYKRTKVNFYKNMPKNYYRPQFSRDKLESRSIPKLSKLKKQIQVCQFLKDYRIKTSLGYRPFEENASISFESGSKEINSLNASFAKSQPCFFPRNSKRNIQGALMTPNNLSASNIDGLGLMINPFDVKLKKRRK